MYLDEYNTGREILGQMVWSPNDHVTGCVVCCYLHNNAMIAFVQKRSWKDARISCLCRGMDLVAIESEEENRAILEHANTLGGNYRALDSRLYR